MVAELRADVAFFITVTTPSRFHSVNENGSLNPKYNGATVRDASDYLVYDFFAAVRKKKKKGGWAGTACEPLSHTMTARHTGICWYSLPRERRAHHRNYARSSN